MGKKQRQAGTRAAVELNRARKAKMTHEERRESARHAAEARWSKRKAKKA
jgi:hypothetical protein